MVTSEQTLDKTAFAYRMTVDNRVHLVMEETIRGTGWILPQYTCIDAEAEIFQDSLGEKKHIPFGAFLEKCYLDRFFHSPDPFLEAKNFFWAIESNKNDSKYIIKPIDKNDRLYQSMKKDVTCKDNIRPITISSLSSIYRAARIYEEWSYRRPNAW